MPTGRPSGSTATPPATTEPMTMQPVSLAESELPSALVDRMGRRHTDLRLSVTDRCNLRCAYCMPPAGVAFRPHEEILTYEEIARFVLAAAELGLRRVRLTGGEPLVRRGVVDLVRMIAGISGIDEVAMTTNAVLLAPLAEPLYEAGLRRLNVSLDTVDRQQYRRLTRRDELPRALAGIAAARRAGFRSIKLNALAIRGFSEAQVVPLARFARREGLELRLIEYMPTAANSGASARQEPVAGPIACHVSDELPRPAPLGSPAAGDRHWSSAQGLPGDEVLRIVAAEYGPLEPVAADRPGAPATAYRYGDGGGVVGIIRSVTAPFCGACTRLRLTADGKLRNCLFDQAAWDVRRALRSDEGYARLQEILRRSVDRKHPLRGASHGNLIATDRPMHQIGG